MSVPVPPATTPSPRPQLWHLGPASASESPAMCRAMALRPDGCGNASDSTRFDELVPGAPMGVPVERRQAIAPNGLDADSCPAREHAGAGPVVASARDMPQGSTSWPLKVLQFSGSEAIGVGLSELFIRSFPLPGVGGRSRAPASWSDEIWQNPFQPVPRARRGQTTHPQCEPVDGPSRVRGLTTAPRLPPTA